MVDKTQAKISRREVLAFIALQDLPMPLEIKFAWGITPTISLSFDDVEQAKSWIVAFGLEVALTGKRYYRVDDWRGWPVWLSIPENEPGPVDELDEDTSAKLREIAGGDQ